MEISKHFDVDGNGKVNLRDAEKALDEAQATGSVKFIWGFVSGFVPSVLLWMML